MTAQELLHHTFSWETPQHTPAELFEELPEDEVCGLCGLRRPAPGLTACSVCA